MATPWSQDDCNQRMTGTSLLKVIKKKKRRHTNLEVLSWMKNAALNQCYTQSLQKSVRKHILDVRKLMLLSNGESPQRKRKLHIFVKDKTAALEKSNRQISSKLSGIRLSLASSGTFLLHPDDTIGNFGQQGVKSSCSSGSLLTSEDISGSNQASIVCLFNTVDMEVPEQDIPFIDSDESVNGSIPSTPENPSPNFLPNVELYDSDISCSSDILDPTQGYLKKPRRSVKFQKFVGDCLPSMVVPIGIRFQADVPTWLGPADRDTVSCDDNDSDTSKWLGTQVWPEKGWNEEVAVDSIGRGRSETCSCSSPGSADCIKHHVQEQRCRLKSDLGSAFFSWKFDEMGDDVSKLWTLKEQKSFKNFMNSSMGSGGKNFWRHALTCFPSKNRENIVSYYFNIFIPRGLSQRRGTLIKDSEKKVTSATKGKYGSQHLSCRKKVRM